MKGKATFILTDKDTKKPVKQFTEHNIVTTALEKVLCIPPIAGINMSTSDFAANYIPLNYKLMGGIVLLGNTLPEKAENFMVPPDIIPVGAAGQGYTGTNSHRGTFNTSMSGPTENGYKMVWDFAPEKANGVIKCVGLTNICYGNTAFEPTNEINCCMATCPVYMGTNSTSVPTLIAVQGRFYGKLEGTYLYSCRSVTKQITLIKSVISDPHNIRISDNVNSFKRAQVVSENTLDLPFLVQTTSPIFYSEEDKHLYIMGYERAKDGTYDFELCKIDPEAEEIVDHIVFHLPGDETFAVFAFAIRRGKIYLSASGNTAKLFVLDAASKEIIHTRNISLTGAQHMFESDGFLMGSITHSGAHYLYYLEYDNYPPLYSVVTNTATSRYMNLPYALGYTPDPYETTICIVLRTDFLITINNLSAPLEKTDRHALQIRYELTY